MRRILAALGSACVLACPTARAADRPGPDLALEYGFARITNGDGLDLPLGGAVSLGFPVTERVAVAADVRWNHKSESGASLNVTSFQAGPRITFREGGTGPYLQLLAGAGRASVGSLGGSFEGAAATKFCVMPGVGVDVRLAEHVRLRFGGDFRLTFLEGEDEKDVLAHAGVVFDFGR